MVKVIETNHIDTDKFNEDAYEELDKLINISSTYKTEVRKTCASLIESGKIDDMFDYLDRFVVSLEVALTDQSLGEAEPAAREWLDKFFVRVAHLNNLCLNGSGLNPVCPVKIRDQISGDDVYDILHPNRRSRTRGNHDFRHRESSSVRGRETAPARSRRASRSSQIVEIDEMGIGWDGTPVTRDRYDYEIVKKVYDKCRPNTPVGVHKGKKNQVISKFSKLCEDGGFDRLNYFGTHLLVYSRNDNPNSMRIVYLDPKKDLVISHVELPA